MVPLGIIGIIFMCIGNNMIFAGKIRGLKNDEAFGDWTFKCGSICLAVAGLMRVLN